MKKIAVVCDFWNNAGTESAAINWLNLLATEHEVTLFVLEDKINAISQISPNINIKRNIFYSNYYFRVMFLTHCFTLKIPFNKMLRKFGWNQIFKDGEYDAIINFSDSSATYFKYLNFSKTKLIAWNHFNYGENVVFAHGSLESLKEKYYNGYVGADQIISVSNASKNSFNKFFEQYNTKFNVECIYSPQDSAKIIKKADEFVVSEYDNSKIKILNLARIDENQKGQLRLLKVIKKLNEKVDNLEFYFVGDANDVELEKFNNLKNELNLKNVHYLGKRVNPYPYIKGCDLFILPSLFEGYGLVLQEALILHKPVLTTNMTSKEVLENDKYGYVCENNEEGIFNGLLDIFENKETFNSLVNKAKSYMWDNEQLLQKFNKIIEVKDGK